MGIVRVTISYVRFGISNLVYREGASLTTDQWKDGRMGTDTRRGSNGLEASLDGPSVRCQRSAGAELIVGFDGDKKSHVQFLFAHGLILSAATTFETLCRFIQFSKAQGSETSGHHDGSHLPGLCRLPRKT